MIRVTSLGPDCSGGAGAAEAGELEPIPVFTGMDIARVASPPLDGTGV
jgi:hypothetical protein